MKQKGICMKRIIYITIACAFLSVSFAKAQVLTLKEKVFGGRAAKQLFATHRP